MQLSGGFRRRRELTVPGRGTRLGAALICGERAACRGTDLDLFYPERGEPADPARQVCARCPVRQPCLEYALSNRITSGIWGGLTERERRPLQSDWLQAGRRDRDRAIQAADAAGYTTAALGPSFGLSHTSVIRIASGGTEAGRPARARCPAEEDDDRPAG